MEVRFSRGRPVTITVASIIFAIFGILELVAAVVMIVLIGLVAGASEGAASQVISAILGGLAAILLIVSLIDLAVCYGLWNMRRWAAVLGMLVVIFGLIIQAFAQSIFYFPYYYYFYNRFDPYSYFIGSVNSSSQWIDILLFILIAISYRAFEEPPSQTSQG